MTITKDDLIRLIHETKAVSIWNRKTGPVFWYIAGVPGPFYVNTELLIGAEASKDLLNGITAILARTTDPKTRATQVTKAVMAVYEGNAVFKSLVMTLADKARSEFPSGSFDLVSGGERRDWLFSIPFARECGVKHAFLFKDLSIYCPAGININERALHVADLINNAASYLDLWLPALEKAGLACAGTLCVISRGSSGLNSLKERGIKVFALSGIDLPFFEKSCAGGLIDRATLDEIAVHFSSPKAWAEKYLMGRESLFNVPGADPKSFERLQLFFNNDPWLLRDSYAEFFEAMQREIANRKKAA